NRRILIVDADTGKYIGHFGAYGNNPIDDAAAAAAGAWPQASAKGETKPAFFRNPVHCVKIADDGKLYVCDRGNDRIQVFDGNDPRLGKACSNPDGEAGKCGFVAERWVSGHTYTQPVMPGTAVSMNFSTDKAQSCLYVGDNTNQTIYILNRSNLEQLGRLGRARPRGRGVPMLRRDAPAGWPAISTGCTRSAWTAKAISTPGKWTPENASRSSSATAPRVAAAP